MGGRGARSATARSSVGARHRAVLRLADEGKIVIEREMLPGNVMRVFLRGETYENREAIKEAGFGWNKVARAWEYRARPSREDEMLMTYARKYTESRLDMEAYYSSTTPEQRNAEVEAWLASRPSHIGRRRKEAARRGR